MKRNSIILKSLTHLLLVVMLYMHVCSTLCATGARDCCGIEDSDNVHCNNESCGNNKDADGKDHNCQDLHFAFFNTTGQFSQAKADISFKPTQPLVSIFTPLFIILTLSESKILFSYNGFHPPPAKADIRIFISSFQI